MKYALFSQGLINAVRFPMMWTTVFLGDLYQYFINCIQGDAKKTTYVPLRDQPIFQCRKSMDKMKVNIEAAFGWVKIYSQTH